MGPEKCKNALTMLKIILLSCVLLGVVTVSRGFSLGPPTTACSSMFPSAHGVAAKTSSAPYTITTNVRTYERGQNVTVTISATEGEFIMGFFIQARISGSVNPIGRFYKIGGDSEVKLMSCPPGTDNAVSHSKRVNKMVKQLIWNNADGGGVTFQATVVKELSTFWTSVRSEPLTEVETTTQQITTTRMPTTQQITTTRMPTTQQVTTSRSVQDTTRGEDGTTVGDITFPNTASCTTLSVWVLTAFVISSVFST